MAFTLHCGADLFGRKDNIEVVFAGKPMLHELYQRVHAVFASELGAGAAFSIEQVRIYDEVLGRWVDLVKEDQLHPFAQLYAFQPDSAYQTDLRGLIPAPRRTQAGSVVPGHPAQPEALPGHLEHEKERERHVAIAQHLNQQLGGPGAKVPPTWQQPSPAPYATPPHGGRPINAAPLAYAPQGVYSPSEYSPIQATGGPQRWGATEPEAQREHDRHREIAQHLHNQLASPQGGGYAPTPAGTPQPQHPLTMNLAPAATPMQPSPLNFMPAAQHPGAFSPQMPSQPFNSPATPMLGGGAMDEQQAAKERERHRMIAEHLSQQLGGGAASPVGAPFSPHTPVQGRMPPVLAPPQGSQWQVPAGPEPVVLPGVDPQQAAVDAERERERHVMIAQHLNGHLGVASPGSAGIPPSQYAPPGQQAYSPPLQGDTLTNTGAAQVDADKEAERHRLVAQHLNQQLAAAAPGVAAQSPGYWQ